MAANADSTAFAVSYHGNTPLEYALEYALENKRTKLIDLLR